MGRLTWCTDHHECVIDGVFIQPEQVRSLAERIEQTRPRPATLEVVRWGRPGVITMKTADLLDAAAQLERLEGKVTDDY